MPAGRGPGSPSTASPSYAGTLHRAQAPACLRRPQLISARRSGLVLSGGSPASPSWAPWSRGDYPPSHALAPTQPRC